ncbi:MAG: class I SAM-dependent methyltransferase [Phycisphaerae bacterium]|nr:class I SAM-dependent methyltransferase [Phycisphaerae bacterium]
MPHDHTSLSPHLARVLADAQDRVGGSTPHPNYAVYRQQERLYWAAAPRWIAQAGLTDASRVLDVGCAYGTLAVFTRLAFRCSVHGVDFIDAYTPRDLFRRLEIPFAVCNIELDDPPFSPGFDLIVFTEVLEHLNFHPVPTLTRLAGLLRPGGAIVLSTPDAAEWGRVTSFYPRIADMPPPARRDGYFDGHVWQYRVHELLWVFERAGLIPLAFEHSPGVTARHFNALLRRRSEIEPAI